LIGAAVQGKSLPGDSALTLGLFADNAEATIDQIKALGGTVVGNGSFAVWTDSARASAGELDGINDLARGANCRTGASAQSGE